MVSILPQIAFITLVGSGPNETSTPVEGQLVWVLRLKGAVGRPARPKAACSDRVR